MEIYFIAHNYIFLNIKFFFHLIQILLLEVGKSKLQNRVRQNDVTLLFNN